MITSEAFVKGFATGEAAVRSSLHLQSSPLITFGYILQIIFSLAIVFGLMWLTSKYLLPRFVPGSKGKLIEVSDRLMLEPGVSAYVLKVKGQSWLVAVSNKNVVKIGKIDEGMNEDLHEDLA